MRMTVVKHVMLTLICGTLSWGVQINTLAYASAIKSEDGFDMDEDGVYGDDIQDYINAAYTHERPFIQDKSKHKMETYTQSLLHTDLETDSQISRERGNYINAQELGDGNNEHVDLVNRTMTKNVLMKHGHRNFMDASILYKSVHGITHLHAHQRPTEVSVAENQQLLLKVHIPQENEHTYTERWSFLPAAPCKLTPPSIQQVCIKHGACIHDVVVDVDCIAESMEHTLVEIGYVVHASKAVHPTWTVVNITEDFANYGFDTPDVKPGVLKFEHMNAHHAGVYIWNLQGTHGENMYVTFLVKLNNSIENHIDLPAVTPKPKGAEFHTWHYHSHVFSVGETFSLPMHLQYKIHDTPFDLLLEWLYVPINPTCQPMRLYSACVYHETVPSCLSPENPECTFASPHIARRVANTVYQNCEHVNYTADCLAVSHVEPGSGLEIQNGGSALLFVNAAESMSGLYVFIIHFNGHVETVAYTVVSTIENFVNAIEEHGFPPEIHNVPSPSSPNVTANNDVISETNTFPFKTYAGITGGFAVLALVCLALALVCTKRKFGHRSYWSDKAAYGQSTYYAGVPVDDFEDDTEVEVDEGAECGGSGYTVYIDKRTR
ncbi:glycoprotein E [Cercopithecine alphaherpesvirus 9]|uniref:Envelope glycoprotein E n=2 Tax=Cercopithecine herpesvirus 9 (strain DHV) TaxID=36348 RepID=GE_CHV9D|nr:envelope glycoprotein E [Cercopithecine alphaherpesvirus 9]Q04548.1 RecName: Full=Envelope glycoprotein E; AltName: Full=Membrane glycoprotein 2; Short=gE; Flags: Precursor [Cercopithecine herpesvirus 9 (strain DHV)]AAA47889.1 membrane glycoprotein [Cercopithecine alphaherpesvirus 9]AAG27243.1 glycoprotein E [Cercopithecine alphaherpesvirus 9]